MLSAEHYFLRLSRPASPLAAGTPLRLYVLATTKEGTRSALEAAARCAKGLGAHVIVLVPRVLSYALPLGDGVLPGTYGACELKAMTEALDAEVEVEIVVVFCRRQRDILDTLPPGAIVMLGGRRRSCGLRLPSAPSNRLSRRGHRALLVPA